MIPKVDGNNKVSVNSTASTEALDVVGNIKATELEETVSELASDISINTTGIIRHQLVGDGSELTGVSGFATAL